MTLIEVLVVVSIASIVMAAIASAVAAGVMVWHRTRDFDVERMAALTFLQEFERDARNSFSFAAIPFEGEQDSIVLAGPATIDADGLPHGVARIAYLFDSSDNTVCKTVRPYPYGASASPGPVPLLAGVADLEFSYISVSPGGSAVHPSQQDSWREASNAVPAVIRVKLMVHQSDAPVTLSRTIYLPGRVPSLEDEKNRDEDD
jgi:type II secretory pathway pseudopilin PulG